MITTNEAAQALNKWAETIKTRNVEAVVALYDPSIGQLLGTVDVSTVGPRIGAEKIRQYFEHFLANDVVEPTILNQEVIILSDDIAVVNGYYKFKMVKNGATKQANAKFTFIFQKSESGELKIVTHNSGLTPDGIKQIS